jgi:putrescine importer
MAETANATAGTPHLRRVLTLWDLIFYGIVLVQPIAPVPLYGVAQKLSDGHFLTTIFIAMFAMLITAVSYGRMAALYPAAGSAYTYVGRGLNPHLGFLAGWAMILDYILQPIINTVWISTALHERYREYHIPQIPFVIWAAAVVGIITFLNFRGVKTGAVANKVLLSFMFIVVALFIYLAVRYLFHLGGWPGVLSTQPFYDPKTFRWPTVMTATSFAALTYIGFDGVTTLSEEVENPKRNVLLATVLTCIFAGVFSAVEVYLGARVWPDWHTLPNLETAFMDVCRQVGGLLLFHGMGAILILAAFGSALTGGMGAARLLFGMGRDNVLPRNLFGHVSAKTGTPSYSIMLIGAIALAGALGLNYIGSAYQHAGELLNFGAFLAFMGVNLATFWQFTVKRATGQKRNLAWDALLPLFGFAFCGVIWWNLNIVAKTVGGIWFALGVIYVGAKTKGFREKPLMIDFKES